MGILSTPVIDHATSTLYVVAATLENGSDFHRLHALDITSGQEKFGGPVTIQASLPGSGYDDQGGLVIFNSQKELQWAGLLLAKVRSMLHSPPCTSRVTCGWEGESGNTA